MRRLATRMLTLACAAWGLSFPAVKALAMVQEHALPAAGTWFLSGATMVVRFALSALLVLAFVLRGKWRCTASEVSQGLGVGFFGGMGMLFQVDGLAHTEASTSAFLTQGSVIFIPAMKALLLRKLPSRREALCCALAMAGVAVLAQFNWHTLRLGRGEAETLIAALFFTGHILWLERPCYAANDSRRVSLVMFASISLLFLPMIAGSPMDALHCVASKGAWLFLAILIGPCTLLAFLWMNLWQRHVSATAAGLIYCMEPVFASVFALFLPALFSSAAGIAYGNEHFTRELLLGGGLILLANIFMQWPASGTDAGAARMNEHAV